jgi:hypothetical protein
MGRVQSMFRSITKVWGIAVSDHGVGECGNELGNGVKEKGSVYMSCVLEYVICVKAFVSRCRYMCGNASDHS